MKKSTITLLLIIITSILLNCSKSDNSDPVQESDPICPNGITSTITNNHEHTLTISERDIAAAEDKTYVIDTPILIHLHQVDISAGEFAILANGGEINTSIRPIGNHSHAINIKCE